MKRNSKLSLALHALGHMAADPGILYRSEDIARHNDTNAVVVRRVLGQLREAGIVVSARGHSGGWRLAQPARDITVAAVYRALGESVFGPSSKPEAPTGPCVIEKALHTVMNDALALAEKDLLERLDSITIARLGESMHEAGFPRRNTDRR